LDDRQRLISDPFTQYDQKQQLRISKNKMELFSEFHDTLYAGYSESLSGSTHILKMHHLWDTFQSFFRTHTKWLKYKKIKSIRNYEQTVKEVIKG
jgi:hypothetical protein